MSQPTPGTAFDGRPHPFSLLPLIASFRCPECARLHYEGTWLFARHLGRVKPADVVHVQRALFFAHIARSN